MSRRNRKVGRRTGMFIGGVLFGLTRGIFFRNKYWGNIVKKLNYDIKKAVAQVMQSP